MIILKASINIGDFDIKLSAFADDTYFLTLDIQSLCHILDICSVFGDYLSLKLTVQAIRNITLISQKRTKTKLNW